MKYLSQRDPQWADVKLGSSKELLGRKGCTTVCLSMLSDYFGGYVSPKDIAQNTGNYTPDGLIIWHNLRFPHMQFQLRANYAGGVQDYTIKSALRDPNRAVMLEVNNGAHWVVAIAPTLFGNDYVVLDPWTGKKTTAKGMYHNISGAAYFMRV